MKKVIVFIVLMGTFKILLANTDYQCINDCTQRYSYGYCQSQCSYGDNGGNAPQMANPYSNGMAVGQNMASMRNQYANANYLDAQTARLTRG